MSFVANISVELRSASGLFLDPSLDLSEAFNADFQRVRNGIGSGSFTLDIRNPAHDDLPDGTAIGMRIDGTLRFLGRIVSRVVTVASENEEDAETTTYTLVELLGDLADEAVLPLDGYAMLVPSTDERLFSVFANSYDDTDYPAYATALAFQGWTLPTPYWEGEPAGFTDPTASFVWSSSIGATAITDAPEMICIFRLTVLVEAGKKWIEWGCDDIGEFYVDGRQVQSSLGMRNKQEYEFTTGDGILVLAWEVTNAPPVFPGANPAALIASMRENNNEGTIIWNTTDTARGSLSPGNASVPRMNVDTRGPADPRPGHRVGGIVEMIKGRLPDSWTSASDYLLDDNGAPWDSINSIAFRIFEDSVWDVFAQLMEIWVDMRASVTGVVSTYRKGTIGDPIAIPIVTGYSAAGQADPDSVNVREMSVEVDRPQFDKIAARWRDGWVVNPLTPLSVHERIQAVRMENVDDAGLAFDLAGALLELYGVDNVYNFRATSTITYDPLDPADLPFVAFDLHDTWLVPFPVSDGSEFPFEQVVQSISAQGDEEGDVTSWLIELGSPVEDRVKWLERSIARGPGTMGGRARGANGNVLGNWGIGTPTRQTAGHAAHVIASAPGLTPASAGRTSTAPNQFVGKVVTLRLIGQTGVGASTVTVTTPGGPVVLSGSGEGLLDVANVDETWTIQNEITVTLDVVNHDDLHVYADVASVG